MDMIHFPMKKYVMYACVIQI
ncbi:hypothetical protein AGR8A_Lc40037 [Agrobacterium fabrum str. J-07]|nr:hypothetical protein AGR8A_Lc40037 [Agrobacterium fabrum str. J-07]